VFAKTYGELRKRINELGHPLQANKLGDRSFKRLCKAADVRSITFHALRHTNATLSLAAGEPSHVLSERLGQRRESRPRQLRPCVAEPSTAGRSDDRPAALGHS
jgi:integrase